MRVKRRYTREHTSSRDLCSAEAKFQAAQTIECHECVRELDGELCADKAADVQDEQVGQESEKVSEGVVRDLLAVFAAPGRQVVDIELANDATVVLGPCTKSSDLCKKVKENSRSVNERRIILSSCDPLATVSRRKSLRRAKGSIMRHVKANDFMAILWYMGALGTCTPSSTCSMSSSGSCRSI